MTRQGYALLSCAVSVRIAAALLLGDSFHFVDELRYVDAAHRLLALQGFGADYSHVPGYPVLLSMLAAPFPASLRLLRVAQAVVAGLGCALTYVLARRVFDERVAAVAALLYALDPVLVVSSGLLYPEASAAVLLLVVVLAMLRASRRDRLAASAGAGLLAGVLCLFRPVTLAVVPVFVVWLVAVLPAGRARRGLHGAVVLAACLLALAPWTYRMYRVRGELVPVTPLSIPAARTAVYRQHVPAGGRLVPPLAWARHLGIEFAHFWEFYPTRLATDDPEVRVRLRARNGRVSTEAFAPRGLRNTVSALAFAIELPLALVGLLAGLAARRRETLLLGSTILSYALGYAVFIGKLRYRIPVLPLLLVLSGAGALAIHRFVSRRRAAPAGRVPLSPATSTPARPRAPVDRVPFGR